MFTPKHGIWNQEDIEAHPHDAISWAKKEREIFSEEAERNASKDSGWSQNETDRCAWGIAACNQVELAALRFLVKKVVDKMDSKTNAWSEFQGWCPEFEGLRLA